MRKVILHDSSLGPVKIKFEINPVLDCIMFNNTISMDLTKILPRGIRLSELKNFELEITSKSDLELDASMRLKDLSMKVSGIGRFDYNLLKWIVS